VPSPPQVIVQPQALLIPCVGFNRQRMRLGYGGGYYDRTLAASPRPLAIGIAYRGSLATFAADPYDIALDAIITEDGCFD
jgi:5-formyltetrahydrofolate cyclo-ligase